MIPTDPSCHDCRLTLQDPGEAGGQGRDAWVQRGPLASKSRVGPVNLHLASGCQQGGEGSVAVDFSVWLFGSISWWLVYFSGCSHSPSTPSLATDTSVSEFCFFSAPPLKNLSPPTHLTFKVTHKSGSFVRQWYFHTGVL